MEASSSDSLRIAACCKPRRKAARSAGAAAVKKRRHLERLEMLPQLPTRLCPLEKHRFDVGSARRRRRRRLRQNQLERRDGHSNSRLRQFQRENRHVAHEPGKPANGLGNLFGEEAARL